jgi:hypothetical protein
MHLLDLPVELLHEILGWAILFRGIKRGLRLRLVNSRFCSADCVMFCLPTAIEIFAREIVAALSLFKLLDTYFKRLPIGSDEAVPSIATTYLERRVLSERRGGAPVLLWIRSVANRLSQETDDERNEYDYVRQLCPLVLGECSVRLDKLWTVDQAVGWCDGLFNESNLETDVYITAVYTQTLPVVSRRIASRKGLARSSLLFGDARLHAGRYGNQELLAAMMDLRYESDFQRLRTSFLVKAAEYGRVGVTRFVLDFQAVERPWLFSRKIKRPSYLSCNERELALLNTPSREIFDLVMEKRREHCVSRTFSVTEYTGFLAYSARHGWVAMTEHYLALGARVDGLGLCSEYRQRPLLGACRNGHKEVVEVLLRHGASVCKPALETAVGNGHFEVVSLLLAYNAEVGSALAVAVCKGYRSIVRRLLERGSYDEGLLQGLLDRAVEMEDEGMLEDLLAYCGVAKYSIA